MCHVGHLSVVDKIDGIASASSERTFRVREYPQDLEGTFTGLLKCAVRACDTKVTIAGDWAVDVDVDEDGHTIDTEVIRLKYANPALPILVPPDSTPTRVQAAIEQASNIIWLDPSAAGNRLRLAIEELLMKKHIRTTGSDHKPMSTHARIEKFGKRDPTVAGVLMSVKWIGNTGSHEASLTAPEVLDGAELLDLALRLLYDKRDAVLLKRAAAINKRRGLPRKKPTP